MLHLLLATAGVAGLRQGCDAVNTCSTTRDISKEMEYYHYKALTSTDDGYLTCFTTEIHFSGVL